MESDIIGIRDLASTLVNRCDTPPVGIVTTTTQSDWLSQPVTHTEPAKGGSEGADNSNRLQTVRAIAYEAVRLFECRQALRFSDTVLAGIIGEVENKAADLGVLLRSGSHAPIGDSRRHVVILTLHSCYRALTNP